MTKTQLPRDFGVVIDSVVKAVLVGTVVVTRPVVRVVVVAGLDVVVSIVEVIGSVVSSVVFLKHWYDPSVLIQVELFEQLSESVAHSSMSLQSPATFKPKPSSHWHGVVKEKHF